MKSMLFFLFFTFNLLTTKAYAQYLDPGAGSYMLQILIAGLLAFGFYWKSLLNFLLKLFKKAKPVEK